MAQSKTDKKKSRKPARRRPKILEPMKDIIEALKDCKQLMGEGILTLELQYPYIVLFRVDEEKFKSLEGWDDNKRDRFRRILSQEITFGLQGALTDEPIRSFLPFVDTEED